MITFPTSTAEQIFAVAGGVVSDLMPIGLIVIGISIAMWALDYLVDIFTKKKAKEEAPKNK
jgi:hypothetical protein